MKLWLKIKWLCLFTLNILLVLLCAVQFSLNSTQKKHITNLEQKIITLQQQLSQKKSAPDLTPITQNIKQLELFIQQLQHQDNHQLGELFSNEQASIKKQLDNIIELVRHLNTQKHPVKMLPPNQLPFQVLSIDSIQEIPVASVRYHYHTNALEPGDTLAGWKVIRIDFAKQTIEFANQEKIHSIVQLEPLEVHHDA